MEEKEIIEGNKKPLTKSDLENLNKLPENKWFEDIDVWPAVKRTTYSLRRLVSAGYVESKYANQSMKYRKLNDTTT